MHNRLARRAVALVAGFLWLACAAPATAQQKPLRPVRVSTNAGVLVGSSADGINSFKVVPYAQPPVGPLRWAPPQVRWTRVKTF